VTAIIGFVNNQSIILASDSQMSNLQNGTKQCDSKKIAEVNFAGGHSALIARAGSVAGADLFQETFEDMAARTHVTGWRTIADTAEAALKFCRKKVLDGFSHPSLTAEMCLSQLDDYSCSLLIAYFFNDHPFIFSGDSTGAITIKLTHKFAAMGSAASVASFILEGFDLDAFTGEQALALAVYTIEMCKQTDLYCAGRTQVGRLRNTPPFCRIQDPWIIDRMQKAVSETKTHMTKTLGEQIVSRIPYGEIEFSDED
jgi:20S proteasome alpha/beta subunit